MFFVTGQSVIASKLCSHRIFSGNKSCGWPLPPLWEQSLLAMAPEQSPHTLLARRNRLLLHPLEEHLRTMILGISHVQPQPIARLPLWQER